MCDFSLMHVASRAAKVGDRLTTTVFDNSTTRGLSSKEDTNVAVCVLPGTEMAFDDIVVALGSGGFFTAGKSRLDTRSPCSVRSTKTSSTCITMRWSSPTERTS